MKIIVVLLVIVQVLILSPKTASAQSEAENDSPIIRTIVPPAIAAQEQTTGAQFYQNQSLSPQTAFGLTVLATVFMATGLAILKIRTFSEHAYAKQL